MGKARIERRRKARERATRKSRLLCVPAELRNIIVDYCLEDVSKVYIARDDTIRTPPLARTCRQLRQEVLPRLHPRHTEAYVHNFDFREVSRVLKDLPSHARKIMQDNKLLRINLSFDDDDEDVDALQHWLDDCKAGLICTRGIYKFTEPLMKVTAFQFFDRVMKGVEWERIGHRYSLTGVKVALQTAIINYLQTRRMAVVDEVSRGRADCWQSVALRSLVISPIVNTGARQMGVKRTATVRTSIVAPILWHDLIKPPVTGPGGTALSRGGILGDLAFITIST
ncbi:hypothetical protein LTR15_011147 [Elasticomyces elasticus]|nr:hypothetical protein LTR15_011147 [Elasticomyces elasticus]